MTPSLNLDGIPQELKGLDQWIMWKLIDKPGQVKPAKILYTINNVRADTTNPRTWNSFEACVKALDTGLFNGIGFIFSYYDDYIGIDWDNVRDPETKVFDEEIYQEIIDLGSYAEISQSGGGAHVICKGKKPGERSRSGPREMYDKDRFFVMTGNHLAGTPTTINQASPEAIKVIYDKIDLPNNTAERPQNECVESCSMEDKKILSLLMGSAIADKFELLWDGSIAGYPSNSEADQALANYIAFYTQDEGQVESIMRQSGLARNKWDKHPTYLMDTIKKAIGGLTKTYSFSTVDNIEESQLERPVIEDIIQAYPDEVRDEAYNILKNGDPALYIRETVGKRHLGDESVILSCVAAGACLFISNTRGLGVATTGDKGTGKSDGAEKWAETLPPRFVYLGSMSAKSMYYDEEAKPRMVRVFDDVSFNEDQINTIKKMTSNFQKRTEHSAVVNGKNKKMYAPERQVLVMNSVNGVDDDQLLDRFLLVSTENDTCHLEAVADCILGSEVKRFKETDHDIQVCRCMMDILSAEDYEILIPFAEAIMLADKTKLRNIKKFLDTIRSCCLYKVFQRDELGGAYFATLEDFERAAWIYSMSADSNATQLTKKELEYLQFFIEQNNQVGYPVKNTTLPAYVSIAQLVKKFEVGKTAVRNILHGKDGRSGLTNKLQINWESSEDNRNINLYQYYGTEDFNKYAKFASIDHSKLEKCTQVFFDEFDDAYGDTLSPNKHPHITIQKVIGKTLALDTTTTTYHPNIENSIVVDGERGNASSPVDISSFSPERVTHTNTKDVATVLAITHERCQVGDMGCQGVSVLTERVFRWAKDYEHICGSINSANVSGVAIEYCRKHNIAQVDKVLPIFKKYAKIPLEQSPEPAEVNA